MQCSQTPQRLEAGTADFKFQPERELQNAAMAAYTPSGPCQLRAAGTPPLRPALVHLREGVRRDLPQCGRS
jgi:hypothetical protein